MNTLATVQVSTETLLWRIDAIMRELQELRELVVTQPQFQPRSQSQPQPQAPVSDLVAQLAGALAPASRSDHLSVYEEYELISDWERCAGIRCESRQLHRTPGSILPQASRCKRAVCRVTDGPQPPRHFWMVRTCIHSCWDKPSRISDTGPAPPHGQGTLCSHCVADSRLAVATNS